jgi:hypothetical protein
MSRSRLAALESTLQRLFRERCRELEVIYADA